MTTLEMPPYPLTEVAGPGVDGDPDEVLLVVQDWQSRCSGCGGGATTTETAHSTRLPGHGEAIVDRGCGRCFTGVAVAWESRIETEGSARRCAIDLGLPFVGRRPWPWPFGGVA